MHLYPARLGSALPASVARQFSPPLVPLSLFSVLFYAPRLISGSSSSFVSPRPLASRATKSLHEPSDAEEEGRGGGGRSTFLPKETRACRALLFPTLLCSRQSSTQPKKIRYTRQKCILGFRYAYSDKDVTLLECCDRTSRPVCDFDSLHSEYRLSFNWLLE